MAETPVANKIIARAAAEAFGGAPKVTRYWDEKHRSYVDLLSSADRPQPGVISFATIGASDAPSYDEDTSLVRVELVGACGASFRGFDNALSTAAFCIINSHWHCFPGAIFPDALLMYKASPTMRHFLFVPPFLWQDTLPTLKAGPKTIAWLLAVPISEAEREFAVASGPGSLEALFERHNLDIFNLYRPSIL